MNQIIHSIKILNIKDQLMSYYFYSLPQLILKTTAMQHFIIYAYIYFFLSLNTFHLFRLFFGFSIKVVSKTTQEKVQIIQYL